MNSIERNGHAMQNDAAGHIIQERNSFCIKLTIINITALLAKGFYVSPLTCDEIVWQLLSFHNP